MTFIVLCTVGRQGAHNKSIFLDKKIKQFIWHHLDRIVGCFNQNDIPYHHPVHVYSRINYIQAFTPFFSKNDIKLSKKNLENEFILFIDWRNTILHCWNSAWNKCIFLFNKKNFLFFPFWNGVKEKMKLNLLLFWHLVTRWRGRKTISFSLLLKGKTADLSCLWTIGKNEEE